MHPDSSRHRHRIIRRIKDREDREDHSGRNGLPGQEVLKGNYHNDYSPRYGEPYDIYDKARRHARDLRRRRKDSI